MMPTVGGLLLLLLILVMNLLKGGLSLGGPEREVVTKGIFIQVSGDIKQPGVYEICQRPELTDLLVRAGGPSLKGEETFSLEDISLTSGRRIDVRSKGEETKIFASEISAFYKITLGLPLSLNGETMEGLTAVPGIGRKIAAEIVVERAKRGGFQKLEAILSVKGIGPIIYSKIRPYLVL